MVFDGRLLHGAPRELARAVPSGYLRVSFLVNVWLGYKPRGIEPFPDSELAPLELRSPLSTADSRDVRAGLARPDANAFEVMDVSNREDDDGIVVLEYPFGETGTEHGFGSRHRRKGSRRRREGTGASVRGGWRGGGGGAGEAVEENTREMNVRAGSVKTSRGRARKSLATTAASYPRGDDEKVVSTSPPTPTDGRRRSATRQSRPVWRRAKTLGVARVHALPGACLSGLQFRRRGIPDASESDGDVVPPRGVVLGKRRTPHDVHAPRDRRLRGRHPGVLEHRSARSSSARGRDARFGQTRGQR